MDDTKLLGKIGELIDTKLQPIKQQLNTVETKVELVNERVNLLSKKIDKSQEETIEVLSELITTGYNSHEKRIKRVEDHLHLPQIQ
ncbi:MAG TPA: hypothetical protein VMR59_01620 [Patescibacteria group bacterium]|jgi:chaperonin cofactor prefoldin|nr:hypothetical protein [Patescibacteria group bacterium]